MALSRLVPTKPLSLTQSTLTDVFTPRPAGPSTAALASTRSDAHRVSKVPPAKPKSKSKSAASDNRIFTDVLIAIKPIHLANIASQKKNHEYRKYRLRDEVTRLWLYETRDGGEGRSSITHPAVYTPHSRHRANRALCIGNEDFNAGRKESKYGYPVLELYELVRPVTLEEMKSRWGLGGAPMGWRYVGADLWGDRWGDDQGSRAEKATRVF